MFLFKSHLDNENGNTPIRNDAHIILSQLHIRTWCT